ncbi:MAG: succinylglutamate desuccinylase/aspartoacylase family protein [bacterium]|nr:succinylglutamate desuccinylase/aspartoacylase family protein [bacterium]
MSTDTETHPGVHLLPCDISAYRKGNTGIDYVTTIDSGLPGPHVMVNALTHGNELCGAHALTYLFENDVRPIRGRLTLSFANVAAYETFDAANPYASRFIDEDFNRLWDQSTLDGPRKSRELTRARAMREVFGTADHLLDIHSVDLPQPAMLLAGQRAKGRALAAAIGKPRHVVMDRGHDSGKRVRDFATFDEPESPRSACLVECGYHFHTKATDIAIETSLRFLRHLGIVSKNFANSRLPQEADEPQLFVKVTDPVTIETDDFQFVRTFQGFEVIPEEATLIAHDGDRPIRTPYPDCVLVMPAREPLRGKTAVRLGRLV